MTNKILMTIAALCFMVSAQTIDLTGTVTNESTGSPLQGVVVTLAHTSSATATTNSNGAYTLSTTVGVIHTNSVNSLLSGIRLNNGLLEIRITKSEPLSVEIFNLNGTLKERLADGAIRSPGRYKFDLSGSFKISTLSLVKIRQGNQTTVFSLVSKVSSFANNLLMEKLSGNLSKTAVLNDTCVNCVPLSINDTLIFTLSGFAIGKIAINSPIGVNNIALSPAPAGSTVTDIDGNVYHMVTIGTQVWMVENLKTTRLNDGTPVPLVTSSATSSSSPARYWYNNAATCLGPYGAYYNFLAVNTGKLAPSGWRVPTADDWNTLVTFAGGGNSSTAYLTAGGPLKETGTAHWTTPNTGATNASGFTAVPGGIRDDGYGTFYGFGTECAFWSSTGNGTSGTDCRLYNTSTEVDVWGQPYTTGYNVRCIKN